MTVNRTTLLDLPLPVTGTESGTWGDTTNNGLTQYLDIAIAGTLVLSTDADVTLTSTEGDSSATNIGATTAQYAILRWTATGSTTRNITALAQSKTYVVINATGGTQSIVLRGAGPTTGVTIISGEKALCVWNGSDFVKVSSSAAAGGSNTQVQYNSSGVLAGSSNLTFDGTSLTLGGNPTLSAGTANGVLYLNGSKVATSGSALTFDGTTATTPRLALGGTTLPAAGTATLFSRSSDNNTYLQTGSGNSFVVLDGSQNTMFQASPTLLGFNISNSEAMRLTSTGLGIGTSSPSTKLDVRGSVTSQADSAYYRIRRASAADVGYVTDSGTWGDSGTDFAIGASSSNLRFYTNNSATERMRLDSSGNLGLGVTPSAWQSGYTVFQARNTSIFTSGTTDLNFGQNVYINSGGNYTYISNGYATLYNQYAGKHYWSTAPSGTAGNAISFTQAMTLDASGNLLVGGTSQTSGGEKFLVSGYAGVVSNAVAAGIYAGAAGNKDLNFYSDGNSQFFTAARIRVNGDSYTDTGYMSFWTTSNNGSNVLTTAERARINSSGTFFIGNGETAASPSAGILSATGGTGTNIAGADLTIRGGASTGTGAGGVIIFSTAAASGTSGTATNTASERARITSGGDLLVGTTDSSPIGNGVKGIVLNGTDARFDINRNGATPVFVGRFTSSGTLIDFYYAGVSKGSISTDGTNVAYNTSSDYRLKDNQQPLTGSGAFIDALKPKTWNWKADGSRGVGFIAHEVQEVSPGSVVGEKDGEQMQAMEYGSAEFIANIIAELQSLRQRVAALEGTQP